MTADFWFNRMVKGEDWCGRDVYLRQSDVGHDDGVHRAGGIAQRLALVAVRVVLVLVDLALVVGLPGHGALGDADVALLGADGGGLGAEVPVQEGNQYLLIYRIGGW